jgi:hypothetical protein
MKKIIILLIILILPLSIIAQSVQNKAPWSKKLLLKKGQITLKETSTSAETYFKTIDKNKKGSGLKPFKRWEYHWSHYTKTDGTIAPASDLWAAWKQKNELNTTSSINANDTSNWASLGPYSHTNTASWSSGQGRVNVVAIDPSNANTYYVGAPAGGIWKSIDAGINWQPLTDHLPQIGVSGIAIAPRDSNIIYIATGDDDANDSYSVGVWKSTDGGTTWSATGFIPANSMNEIYMDPKSPDTILVATNVGVYKSTNGGTSWTQKLSGDIIDLKMKPDNATIWYAASSNTIYKSSDSGENFSPVTITGFTDSSRIAIDVTPANPNFVYFVSADNNNKFNGIYKSTNSGSTFSKTSETDDIFGSTQAWYDLALTVSDTQENTIYVGVLNIWKSTDGGNNFSVMNSWSAPNSDSYTHADIHFMRFIDGKFFAGTDGGIYRSTNHGAKFTDLTENLAISQFYKISVASQSSGNIAGGLQDNGGYAYSDGNWNNYFGADGMDCAIDQTNPNTYYGFIQYGGSLYQTTDGGKTRKSSTGAPNEETGTGDSGGRWVTPMVSNSKGEIYAGYSQLYKLVRGNWEKISNHTFDGDLYHIEIDPNNDNAIYASRGSGLYKSDDAGKTFTKLTFSHGTVNSIEISNNESNVAWVVVNNGVYKSTNMTSVTPTFSSITNNLPSESKLVLRHHPGHVDNRIYLGTTLGVYYLDDTSTTWTTFDNNLPNVAVRDLEINEKDSKLIAGTYGRGVFISDIPKSLPSTDVKLVAINSPVQNSIGCGTISPKITVRNQGSVTISSVTVNYSVDGGATTTFNWTGTILSENSKEITVPTNSISKGTHTLGIEVTTTNDQYASNNKSSNTFIINQVNATPTTINSFETVSDELYIETSGATTNLWQRGVPNKTLLNTVGSGTNAYVTGLTGNHPDKTTSYLYTNCYNLSLITSPILQFKMAFDIEKDWDHMFVEYSTNQGGTWAILGTASDANWYNSSSTQNGLPGKQWTGEGEDSNSLGGTNATLHDYSYDLAAFKDEASILFRFKFLADDASNEEGALIDDLVITGVLPVDEFEQISGLSIYPNPSNSVFNITWKAGQKFSISIFDIAGKSLLHKDNSVSNTKSIQLDLSNFNKGLYIAKIKIDDKQTVKKLIVE